MSPTMLFVIVLLCISIGLILMIISMLLKVQQVGEKQEMLWEDFLDVIKEEKIEEKQENEEEPKTFRKNNWESVRSAFSKNVKDQDG